MLMLTHETAAHIAGQAYRLLHGDKRNVRRALLRFIAECVDKNFLHQSYCYDQGYNKEQLDALATYAKDVDDAQQAYLLDEVPHLEQVVKRIGTVKDTMFGIVMNSYEFLVNFQLATNEDLRDVLRVIVILGDQLSYYRDTMVFDIAGISDYRYRNLPSSICPDEDLWCIGGSDKRTQGGGVLEWCYDAEDAALLLAEMNRYPDRFQNLSAASFADSSVRIPA